MKKANTPCAKMENPRNYVRLLWGVYVYKITDLMAKNGFFELLLIFELF
ncbi:MAG: hypothetical protein L6300_06070 [Syntrophaceae bacterium]|nr:hypothetical protein [Syntrophaceae bacterium]